MPPRKKAKASAASTPLGDLPPKTPQDSGAAQSQDDLLNDRWQDEQETQLFKSMMKWKPTGLHKHFRMISIHNDMRSHGFAGSPHTRIPNIWKKLDQLYDLETLDSRENEFAFSEDPDPNDPDDAADMPEFELPEEDFGEMMWQKRFHSDASSTASSPALLPINEDKALFAPGLGLLKDLPEEKRSKMILASIEEEATKSTKTTRSSRAKSAKGTKASARNAKPPSVVSDSEEGEDEDEEGEEEESGSEEEEEEEQEVAPSTRRTNRSKAKPAPKRTRKR